MTENLLQLSYLTIEEASALLRVPGGQIYQLTHARRLRFFKPGRRLLFLRSDLEAFVQASVVEPSRTINSP